MPYKDPKVRKERAREISRLWYLGHKEEHNARCTARYREHREEKAVYQHERAKEKKRQFLDMYGGTCECCGEDTFEFLTIEHRKGTNRTCFRKGVAAWTQAIKQYNPQEYGVLCSNCNQATRLGKVCPHKLPTAPRLHQGRHDQPR